MNICSHCFRDAELKRFVSSNSKVSGYCECCTNSEKTEVLSIDELLDFFDEFLSIFEPLSTGTDLSTLIDQDWQLFSGKDESQSILTQLASRLNLPTSDLTEKFGYVQEIRECTSFWGTLKDDLKWKRRFLTNVEEMIDLGWDSFFSNTIKLGPKESLYRARIHKNEAQANFKKREMGSPIREFTSAGRANPQGIPYLYLSKSMETTLYETRATYLDEVSIGRFKPILGQDVILVDFTEPISAFLNIGNILHYAKSMLLKKLVSADLSKPLRRFDSELEYIPTQFICEFIRYITNADGILFESSLHRDGQNIVLFEQEKVKCVAVKRYQVGSIKIIPEEIKNS